MRRTNRILIGLTLCGLLGCGELNLDPSAPTTDPGTPTSQPASQPTSQPTTVTKIAEAVWTMAPDLLALAAAAGIPGAGVIALILKAAQKRKIMESLVVGVQAARQEAYARSPGTARKIDAKLKNMPKATRDAITAVKAKLKLPSAKAQT